MGGRACPLVAWRVVVLRHTPWVCSRAICRSIESVSCLTQWPYCINLGCCTRLESPAPWVAAGGAAPLPTDPAYTNVTGEGAALGSACHLLLHRRLAVLSSHCLAFRVANPTRARSCKACRRQRPRHALRRNSRCRRQQLPWRGRPRLQCEPGSCGDLAAGRGRQLAAQGKYTALLLRMPHAFDASLPVLFRLTSVRPQRPQAALYICKAGDSTGKLSNSAILDCMTLCASVCALAEPACQYGRACMASAPGFSACSSACAHPPETLSARLPLPARPPALLSGL